MILQALNEYYDRVASAGTDGIAPHGFSEQKIWFGIVLGADGVIVDVDDLRIQDGKRRIPCTMLVPQPPKRSGRNPPPAFLWDKTGYVFGLERDEADKNKATENTQYRQAFRDYHEGLLGASDDIGLRAILAFLRDWSIDKFHGLRHAADMLDTNVVFRLEGERGWIHDRPAAKTIWANALAGGAPKAATLCLVTGIEAPVARLHPSIKGVEGGQSSGASIVSFNLDAFESYGKEQGANAPVSEAATFAYTTALNALLSRTLGRTAKNRPIYRNRVQIGDATTVFWAESGDPKTAEQAEAIASAMFNPFEEDPAREEADTDASATTAVGDILKMMADGRPIEVAAPSLAPSTRFYVLGLSPNAARISVRFWHPTTLGDLAAAFQQHWRDMAIEPLPWKTAPAIWRLLVQTAVQGKFDNVPPNLAGEVMRAILNRSRYPRTLLSSVIMRIRADGDINGLRAAIIKTCLVRQQEEIPVALDRGNTNTGYRLGRLFAVLESAQKAALPGLNATIRDRYFGAASATPASVFPLLIRNSSHHLANLRKGDKGGLAVWLDREIGEVMDGVGSRFPGTLRLEEQGQFAIGYYHQRFAKRADKPADLPDVDTPDTDTTE